MFWHDITLWKYLRNYFGLYIQSFSKPFQADLDVIEKCIKNSGIQFFTCNAVELLMWLYLWDIFISFHHCHNQHLFFFKKVEIFRRFRLTVHRQIIALFLGQLKTQNKKTKVKINEWYFITNDSLNIED